MEKLTLLLIYSFLLGQTSCYFHSVASRTIKLTPTNYTAIHPDSVRIFLQDLPASREQVVLIYCLYEAGGVLRDARCWKKCCNGVYQQPTTTNPLALVQNDSTNHYTVSPFSKRSATFVGIRYK